MLETIRELPGRPLTPAAMSLLAIVAAASAMGVLAVFVPSFTILGIVGLAVLVAFVRAPAWVLVVVVVASLTTAEVVRSELLAAGVARTTAGLLGLGHVSMALTLLAIARIVLRRDVPRVPTGVLVALGLYVLSIMIQAQVSMIRGTANPTILADLTREISFMGGFVIGLIAVQSATDRIRLYRAFAVVATACSIGSIIYWGWATDAISVPPGLDAIFEHTRERVVDSGVAPDRAKFPFVFMHPNLSGFLFVSMAVFAIPPLLESKHRGDRFLAILLLTTTAGGVLSTQSRTAFLALGTGTVAYLLLTRDLPGRTRAFIIGAVALIAVGTWTAYQLIPDNRSFSDVSTLESRQDIWSDAFVLFAESPLIGNGFQVSTFGLFGDEDGTGQSVHNEYLGRLVDGGLIGFGLWLWVVGTFAVIAWSLWRSHGSRSAEGTSLLAFLVVLCLTMLANSPWSSSTAPIFIWMFFGMGTGSYIVEGREQPLPD